MKRQALYLLVLVVSQTLAVPSSVLYSSPVRAIKQDKQLASSGGETVELCGVCIQFADEFIQNLLNIILNAGVIGTCSELCGILANKVNNKYVGVVCDILCDVVGVKEFVKIIEEADLDPIYYCELLKLCAVKDDGDATITSFTIEPKSGPQGEFKINVQFSTTNGTGTGEAAISIRTVDGIPLGNSQLMEPKQPGGYGIIWTIKAKPDPNCDPSQGPCEMWEPGVYSANVEICNGQCGSKHPHSQIYTTASGNFTIVNGK